MQIRDLEKLHAAAERLVERPEFDETVARLREDVRRSPEPFAWSVIDLDTVGGDLPESIESGWIFVLKAGVPSGCHYHPNSIQHMVVVSGQGESNVGGETRRMARMGSPDVALEDLWYVIGEGVPHEFFPEDDEMVVVSFHTCAAEELEEIACGTGQSRTYEGGADA